MLQSGSLVTCCCHSSHVKSFSSASVCTDMWNQLGNDREYAVLSQACVILLLINPVIPVPAAQFQNDNTKKSQEMESFVFSWYFIVHTSALCLLQLRTKKRESSLNKSCFKTIFLKTHQILLLIL